MPNRPTLNKNKIIQNLSSVYKLDTELIPKLLKMFEINSSSHEVDVQSRQTAELITAIQDNYYTFSSSAKNKKFGFIKGFFYRQLFKYLHKQIYYNEYVKSLLIIYNLQIDTIQRNINDLKQSLPQMSQEINSDSNKFDEHLLIQNRINALYEMTKTTLIKNKNDSISEGKKIFYSQFGEDNWLANNYIFSKSGYFIDVGAGDGITFSNTYYFEKNGWKGICFEPNPENYHLAKMFRKYVFPFAVSSDPGLRKFFIDPSSPDFSHLVPKNYNKKIKTTDKHYIQIKAVSLQDIIKTHKIKKIDILSIDTEGTEIDALNSFEINLIAPKIIIVEYMISMDVNQKTVIMSYFKNLPYNLVHSTYSNLIFERCS